MRVALGQSATPPAHYQAVVDDIDERIARLEETRRAIVGLIGAVPPPLVLTEGRAGALKSGRAKTLAKRVTKLKARLTGSSGTSALVLAAMKAGADTLAAIAKDCKVKPSQARTALLALEDAGRVKRQGKSRATRYQLTNDK